MQRLIRRSALTGYSVPLAEIEIGEHIASGSGQWYTFTIKTYGCRSLLLKNNLSEDLRNANLRIRLL
jgi:hypothetical protein